LRRQDRESAFFQGELSEGSNARVAAFPGNRNKVSKRASVAARDSETTVFPRRSTRDDALEPETVRCPVGECPVTYAVYNYLFSDREANLASLMYGLKIHHPNHPVRAVLNEPRME
jgi:hypothetical protein